jgi:SMI1-KNR4 cell-wall
MVFFPDLNVPLAVCVAVPTDHVLPASSRLGANQPVAYEPGITVPPLGDFFSAFEPGKNDPKKARQCESFRKKYLKERPRKLLPMIGSIVEFLEATRDPGDYRVGGSMDETLIRTAEQALGLKFPLDYQRFLKEVGWVVVDNSYFFGVGTNAGAIDGEGSVVRMTECARATWRLPHEYVVVYSSDDVVLWCFDGRETTGVREIVAYDTRKKCVTGRVASSFWCAISEYLQD